MIAQQIYDRVDKLQISPVVQAAGGCSERNSQTHLQRNTGAKLFSVLSATFSVYLLKCTLQSLACPAN